MNRGARHQAVFRDDHDRRAFLALLGDAADRFGLETHAYCLMGNHFHLLVRTLEPNLGRAMQHVAGLHARWFNDSHGCDGPLFRGRYTAKLIDTDPYLLQASRYIHRNPVEADLVDRPGDYRWSSHRNYEGVPCPRWLRCDVILGVMGQPAGRRRYLEYVDGPAPATGAANTNGAHDRLTELLARSDSAVARAFGLPAACLGRGGRGTPNLARAVAAMLARDVLGIGLPTISARYGYPSPGSASTAIGRLRRAAAADPVLESTLGPLRVDLHRDTGV